MACDSIESQGTLFWDMKNRRWSAELCALVGLPVKTLPRIGDPAEMAGKITAGAAAATGLPKGIPVMMGASNSAV